MRHERIVACGISRWWSWHAFNRQDTTRQALWAFSLIFFSTLDVRDHEMLRARNCIYALLIRILLATHLLNLDGSAGFTATYRMVLVFLALSSISDSQASGRRVANLISNIESLKASHRAAASATSSSQPEGCDVPAQTDLPSPPSSFPTSSLFSPLGAAAVHRNLGSSIHSSSSSHALSGRVWDEGRVTLAPPNSTGTYPNKAMIGTAGVGT